MNTDEYEQALQIMYSDQPDVRRAYELLLAAETRGDARASNALAIWHRDGKDPVVKKNFKIAVEKLKAAADGLVPEAMYNLAVCYDKGHGVPQSEARAFDYYAAAGAWGERRACFEVARFYAHGLVVAADDRMREIWLKRAEALGMDVEEEFAERQRQYEEDGPEY